MTDIDILKAEALAEITRLATEKAELQAEIDRLEAEASAYQLIIDHQQNVMKSLMEIIEARKEPKDIPPGTGPWDHSY